MSDLDKINIYVPEWVGTMIDEDALSFEVFKKDGKTINKNRFLTLLIKGYYKEYIEETYDKHKQIIEILKRNHISGNVIEDLSEEILNQCILPEVPARKGKNPQRLSLKPTNETEDIITMLMNKFSRNDYISQYFCKMFISYCQKPLFKRERIIFKENYEILDKACKEKQVVRFYTTWNKNIYHEVVPYKIAHKNNFNYLICQEQHNENVFTASYRLNRLGHVIPNGRKSKIEDTVLSHLKTMERYDPAYAINSDDDICVRIKKSGITSFIRIYQNRPVPFKIEESGEDYLYYFKCSQDQVFIYFKKFNEAEILYPDELRTRMIEYHKNAISMYKK